MIERFNWCCYVQDHVFDSARKLRHDLQTKGTVTSLSGCHLFLQVQCFGNVRRPLHTLYPPCQTFVEPRIFMQILFLDNVDLRGLNRSHNNLPRIMDFDSITLNKMIISVQDRDGETFTSFTMVPSTFYYFHHCLPCKCTLMHI